MPPQLPSNELEYAKTGCEVSTIISTDLLLSQLPPQVDCPCPFAVFLHSGFISATRFDLAASARLLPTPAACYRRPVLLLQVTVGLLQILSLRLRRFEVEFELILSGG